MAISFKVVIYNIINDTLEVCMSHQLPIIMTTATCIYLLFIYRIQASCGSDIPLHLLPLSFQVIELGDKVKEALVSGCHAIVHGVNGLGDAFQAGSFTPRVIMFLAAPTRQDESSPSEP